MTRVFRNRAILDTAGTTELLAEHHCGGLWRHPSIGSEEVARGALIRARPRISVHVDGIISQFEGDEQLEQFDFDGYRATYGNIGRLDLILQTEGDTTNRYKLSKQADALMLLYLFSSVELRNIFAHLGDALDPGLIPATVRYYPARTRHGSTLSRVTHSWVLARTNRSCSCMLFEQALEADLADTQGRDHRRRHPPRSHGRHRRYADPLLRGRRSPA